jgi:Fe-S-cluster containining protein
VSDNSIDRHDVERALRFNHIMMMVIQDQGNEAVAYVQALADLLVQKGLIRHEELEEPLEQARQEVAKVPMPRVRLAEMGDKYAAGEAVEVDCAARIPLCQGRCCTFRFFLTKQDLEEGAAEWDYGNPYWIKQREDGFCVHSDPTTHLCTIHDKRPHVCRKYSCRDDKRIWKDFEARIPATLPEAGRPAGIAMAEPALQDAIHEAQEDGAEGTPAGPSEVKTEQGE